MVDAVLAADSASSLQQGMKNFKSGRPDTQGTQRKSFRLVATVVRAVKRWQAALNPTYTYGIPHKEAFTQADGEPAWLQRHRVQTSRRPASGRIESAGRSGSMRTASGRPLVPGVHHGHKAQLLFQQLPEVPTQA